MINSTRSDCCDSPNLVESRPYSGRIERLDTGITEIVQLPASVCLSCGQFSKNADGAIVRLTADEIAERKARWDARVNARRAVTEGVPLNDQDVRASFPDPFSLPLYGCAAQLGTAALLTFDDQTDTRAALRAAVGMLNSESRLKIQTPVGEVQIDSVYFDHIHEIDTQNGKNRIDADHLSYAPVVRTTLQNPTEVFLQQSGGARTRRKIFLALYQFDSHYVYHAVITAKNDRVLTAYRLNGGASKFRSMRFGIPMYVSY